MDKDVGSSDQYDGVSAHAGFPNPALDKSLTSLDLHRLIVKHPSSTFFMRLEGNDWVNLGIFSGDIVLVDRAIDPRKNDLVVWHDGDQFMISFFSKIKSGIEVWGVVTAVVHQFRSS